MTFLSGIILSNAKSIEFHDLCLVRGSLQPRAAESDVIYTDCVTLHNHRHNFMSFLSHLFWEPWVRWRCRASTLPQSIILIPKIKSVLSHKHQRCSSAWGAVFQSSSIIDQTRAGRKCIFLYILDTLGSLMCSLSSMTLVERCYRVGMVCCSQTQEGLDRITQPEP